MTAYSQGILHLLGEVKEQALKGSLGHLMVRLHYVLVVVWRELAGKNLNLRILPGILVRMYVLHVERDLKT